jgi:hypothetical protein
MNQKLTDDGKHTTILDNRICVKKVLHYDGKITSKISNEITSKIYHSKHWCVRFRPIYSFNVI